MREPFAVTSLQHPFRGRDSRLAGINTDGDSQGPGSRLEEAFRNVMTVPPMMQHKMQVHQGIGCERLPEDFDELRVEGADFLGRHVIGIDKPEAATQVESRGDQRLFHRQGQRTIPGDPLLVAEGLAKCLSQADAGIFDAVMVVDVRIPFCPNGEIEQSMLGEEFQHVIKKADPGLDVGNASSVEVERQFDVCFARAALNSRNPGRTHWFRFVEESILKSQDTSGVDRFCILCEPITGCHH